MKNSNDLVVLSFLYMYREGLSREQITKFYGNEQSNRFRFSFDRLMKEGAILKLYNRDVSTAHRYIISGKGIKRINGFWNEATKHIDQLPNFDEF